jgi:hypothetical protein
MNMRQVTTINVPFTQDNVKKCRCPLCPVQHTSQCVKQKVDKIQSALKANPMDPQEIPAAYCAQGIASCKDIDTQQTCICDTCLVFSEYNLAGGQPAGYFCRDGKPR